MPEDRSFLLETARQALHTGDVASIQWIMERLPNDSPRTRKMHALLQERLQALQTVAPRPVTVPSPRSSPRSSPRQSPPRPPPRPNAPALVESKVQFQFRFKDIDPHFLQYCVYPTEIVVTLNSQHPALPHLTDALGNLQSGVKLLLMAWIQMEVEVTSGPRSDRLQETRIDWGRVLRRLTEE